MVEEKLFGKKNNQGFYNYDEKGKAGEVNSKLKTFLPSKSKKISEKEIQLRVFLPMINEASYILDEKIVASASDVDLALIFGIGFPPFRGGLLRYADSEGLENIVKEIKRFSQEVDSSRYAVSPYLESLINSNKKFYD